MDIDRVYNDADKAVTQRAARLIGKLVTEHGKRGSLETDGISLKYSEAGGRIRVSIIKKEKVIFEASKSKKRDLNHWVITKCPDDFRKIVAKWEQLEKRGAFLTGDKEVSRPIRTETKHEQQMAEAEPNKNQV
jgi:hypothetical protein